jgi:hypothetical protein
MTKVSVDASTLLAKPQLAPKSLKKELITPNREAQIPVSESNTYRNWNLKVSLWRYPRPGLHDGRYSTTEVLSPSKLILMR